MMAGTALWFIRVDREFINLGATTGQQHRIVLQSEHVYRQEFRVTQDSIASLGLHFRRLKESLPADSATVRLFQHGDLLGEKNLPLVFLSQEDATQIQFGSPLPVTRDEFATIEVTIPPSLSNKVALQAREVDGAFAPDSVSFFIDREPQTEPLGYQVYFSHQPPLAVQVGGLLWITAAYMLFPPRSRVQKRIWLVVYAAAASMLFSWPAHSIIKLPLTFVSTLFLIVAYSLLRRRQLEPLAALFGAHIIAFSSWLPLHLLASHLPKMVMSARDTFLDPNQVLPHHAAGSYVGVFAILFAVVGIITKGRQYYAVILVGALAGLIGMLPRFSVPSLIIVTTITIAFFAAVGLQMFRRYLGENDRLVSILVYCIVLLSLLDLWHVAATTFYAN